MKGFYSGRPVLLEYKMQGAKFSQIFMSMGKIRDYANEMCNETKVF